MPFPLPRWTALPVLALALTACGDHSHPEPRSRPSDLEVLQAANEDLGLRVPRPTDAVYIKDPFPESVVDAWFDSESLRRRSVSRDDWIAHVERANDLLDAGEWIVASTEIVEILDESGSEAVQYTLRIVARFR